MLIFLGEVPPGGVRFKKPGAHSKARWMAYALYCFKLYLFRYQLKGTSCELSGEKEIGLRDVCIYLVTVYVEYWFSVPNAAAAPRNDLNLIKKLLLYKANSALAEVALKKVLGQLWYLSEEQVALSLFDPIVPLATKQKMI